MPGRQKTTCVLSDEEEPAVNFAPLDAPPGEWKTPLFANACDDKFNFAMACCCPCVALGKVLSVFGIMTLRNALVVAMVWLTLLVLSIVNVLADNMKPGPTCAIVFVVFLSLLPSLTLFNLRFQARDDKNIPKADWEDVCCAIWCFPFVLAQLSVQVGSNTPGECDFEDNAMLIAYSTA
ncbi:hypothetical protein ACHHYP_11687 [Achlya hypogyna]|uniref:Transmembrane protein n=1 Tax=Achlya hypogyna TaxID=1202772 RepID=A0A1V9YIR0_ACHHY|nr:hypothetical protein ACHHYP_11687 [Achlya hypogyna]